MRKGKYRTRDLCMVDAKTVIDRDLQGDVYVSLHLQGGYLIVRVCLSVYV